MAAIKNKRDKFLQDPANAPRLNVVASNYIQLSSPTLVFRKTAAGISPSTIPVLAVGMGRLEGLPVTFSTVSGTGTVSVAGNTATVSNVTTNNIIIKASITYLGNTYEALTTITAIDDTVICSISKSSASVPADHDGTNPVLTTATSTATITVGSTIDTANWTYLWTIFSGSGTLSGSTTSSINVATMTTDSITVRLTATKATYPTQTLDFVVTKAKAGPPGADGADGTGGVVVDLSNQVHVVATNSDGTGANLSGAGGFCKVFNGSTEVTSTATFSIVGGTTTKTQNDLTMTIAPVTGAYTLTGTWTSDNEYFDIRAVYSSSTVVKRYSISKAKSGAAGSYYYIHSTASVIAKNAPNAPTSGTYTPASIVITGKRVSSAGVSSNYGYVSYKINGGTESAKTLNTVTYTPDPTNVSSVTILMYDTDQTTLLDTEDIPVVFKGDTGTGTPGADGNKIGSAVCYKWAASAPSIPSGSFNYTWSTGGVSAYPGGWSATPPGNVNTGWTLYRLEVKPTATAIATTTTTDWNTGSLGSFGYTAEGGVGILGGSARRAYLISASATPPTAAGSTAGDTLPSGWSGTPSTPTSGQYLYQVDGTYNTSGNTTTWVTQSYLSSLKVGSLSAISASMGILNVDAALTVGTSGAIASSGKAYGGATAGFFLGYSGGYKFDIGNSTNYFRWDGTNLSINGGSIIGSAINIGSGKFSVSSAGVLTIAQIAGDSVVFNTTNSQHTTMQITAAGAAADWAIHTNGSMYIGGNIYGNSVRAGDILIGGSGALSTLSYVQSIVGRTGYDLGLYAPTSQGIVFCTGGRTSTTGWRLTYQPDSNLVIYNASNVAVWQAGVSTSDIRYKDNIIKTKSNGLDIINNIDIYDFSYKSEESKVPTRTGVMAQYIRDIVPQAVVSNINNENNETLLVHKEELVPFLIKAVQELHNKVKVLEDKLCG